MNLFPSKADIQSLRNAAWKQLHSCECHPNLHTCHFQLMFNKYSNKPNSFISLYTTEGWILKCESLLRLSILFGSVLVIALVSRHKVYLFQSPSWTKTGLWYWPWPSCAALPVSAAGRICPLFLWIPSSHHPVPTRAQRGDGETQHLSFKVIKYKHIYIKVIHHKGILPRVRKFKQWL